jgi:DNA invertase Pin-like site-specific DNA recombinase
MAAGRVVGYRRCSTAEQAKPPALGLAAQADAILARYPGAEIVTEVGSAKGLAGRPVLRALVDRMRSGDRLVVSKLDRLARNTRDLLGLVERARAEGWAIEMLDLGPTDGMVGEVLLTVLGAFATFERRRNSERVVDAVDAANAGLARRRERIRSLWGDGLSKAAIARECGCGLNTVRRELARVR